MKKALIIIGAVFAGLALLAIVGSLLPSDEPQEVIVVEPTPAQEADVQAAAALTDEELRVYRYIERTFPKVDDLYSRTQDAIDVEDPSALVSCCEEFIKYAKTWERLDWANGEVTDLETAFGAYMEGSRKFYKNWLAGTFGDGNVSQCAANAIKAQDTIETWAPRVEDRLVELEAEVY